MLTAPTANAGVDQQLTLPTSSTTLDGTKSSAPSGTSITGWLWTKVSGPSAGTISTPNASKTSISGLISGVYTFRLKVTASNGASATDDMLVTVTDPIYYFKGNMQNVTLAWKSSGTEMTMTGWDDLLKIPGVKGLYLNLSGSAPYVYEAIKPDPLSSATNVMWGQVIDDDPAVSSTSRAQMTINYLSGQDYGIYHSTHRLYLHPDLAYLQQYSGAVTWFTLFETWNEDGITKGIFPDGDPAGSSKISLSAFKNSGAGQPLYWDLTAQTMQPLSLRGKDIYKYTNRTVPVPIGKWVTFDIYLKRGDASTGRFIVSITPDGGTRTLLFDLVASTIYPDKPELTLFAWQPFKLYLSDTMLDWMRTNNKTVGAYFNDYRWLKQ